MVERRSPLTARVVVAVVNFNRAALTLSVLDSVSRLSHRFAEITVVVVDNGSDGRDFEELMGRIAPGVTVLRTPTNVGYAGAANAAAVWATTRGSQYLWLLNNDVTLPEDALDQLVQAATSSAEHGLCGAVAPVIVTSDAPTRILSAGVDVDLWRGRVRHRLYGRAPDDLPNAVFEVEAVEGSAPLILLDAILRVGGLDAGFFMYWEDTEWSLRARNAGYRLAVVPSVHVGHALGQSSSDAWRTELMIRNRMRFMRAAGTVPQQLVFFAYFLVLWVPAYLAARLIPTLGIAQSFRLICRAVAWNARDAMRRGRWRILRSDQDLSAPHVTASTRRREGGPDES